MSQYPSLTAGELSVATLQAMLENFVIKPSATTRTSTTTATDDPDLVTATLEAGGIYYVEFVLRVGALQAAGIKTVWSVPSGAAGARETMGPGSANATETNANTTEMRWAIHGYATAAAYTSPRNSTANLTHIVERSLITIGATAGPVTMQWAQNASNATGSVVSSGSYVRYRRIG